MSQRAIREYDVKMLWQAYSGHPYHGYLVDEKSYDEFLQSDELLTGSGATTFVVKPDQLFGKRGKYGLVGVNLDGQGVKDRIADHRQQEQDIKGSKDTLHTFLIEPFVPHDEEYYLAIKTERDGDVIYFSEMGGMDIEEQWEQVKELRIPVLEKLDEARVSDELGVHNEQIISFITDFFVFFRTYGFAYLEVNPFVLTQNNQKVQKVQKTKNGEEFDEKTEKIIGIAIELHKKFKDSVTEKQLQHMLADDLSAAGFAVEKEKKVKIQHEGKEYGYRYIDLLVDGGIIIELKKTSYTPEIHKSQRQARAYLDLQGKGCALVLNFGFDALHIKRLNYFDKEDIITSSDSEYSETSEILCLDMVARVDTCEGWKQKESWKDINWVKGFGSQTHPLEAQIEAMDAETGASLKFSTLNPQGRIGLILGGGGASVVTMDKLADMGILDQVINYGELSGNPNYRHNKKYVQGLLDLMCSNNHAQQWLCLIGGIANFTKIDVLCQAFVDALAERVDDIKQHHIHLLVRRGGVNDTQGLALIETFCIDHEIPYILADGDVYLTEAMEKIVL